MFGGRGVSISDNVRIILELNMHIIDWLCRLSNLHRHSAKTLSAESSYSKASGLGIRAQAPFAAATQQTRQPSR